jgi:hypothetical protein
MNGIHDMGGMQGMGPLQYEKNEPVYHAEWESRVDAMDAAMWATGKIPGARRSIEEKISAVDYLRIESGQPAERSTNSVRPVSPAEAVEFRIKNASARQNVELAPRFQIGQQVRARNMNPVTYTRLPRYARGRLGTIDGVRGGYPFPGGGAGGKPQTLYSVRFTARDLWGDDMAPKDAVYVDLWDGYLEPV